MVGNVYNNAFKEVYVILENTDIELVNKIPIKFMDFLKKNMNDNYEVQIDVNVDIDKQKLLKETEGILSLIYRSYWATSEEKQEFQNKIKNDLIEKKKKEGYSEKNIYQIFEERKNLNDIKIDNNLMVIKKDNFIKRFFNKIVKMFKK